MSERAVRLGSTQEDRQGEKYDRQFYEMLLRTVPTRVPIYRNHDPSLPALGWLCNCRLTPDPDGPGEWLLVANLEVTDPADYEAAVRLAPYFSWSATMRIASNSKEPLVDVFLPFPHYRNRAALDDLLASEEPIQVGGILRKAWDPVAIALIVGPTIATAGNFLITPVWRRIYEDEVHPLVKPLIQRTKARLGIPSDYLQKLRGPSGRTTEVWLVPSRASEDTLDPYFVSPILDEVGRLAAETWEDELRYLKRVRCAFDELEMTYRVISAEYADGEIRTFART